MQKQKLPMKLNLQFFAAPGDGGEGNQNPANNPADPSNPPSNPTPPAIDYDKIQQMLTGTLQAKEDTALKAYFKQQGLSQQEVEQAIAIFKERKAANQPNVEALQQQTTQAQQQAQQAIIERDAYMLSGELGVDMTTMSYVLKMADVSAVVENGQVNKDKLKEALNKVLEDLPQLKPQAETQQSGFRQIGVGNQQQTITQQQNQPAHTPQKRWNRWN